MEYKNYLIIIAFCCWCHHSYSDIKDVIQKITSGKQDLLTNKNDMLNLENGLANAEKMLKDYTSQVQSLLTEEKQDSGTVNNYKQQLTNFINDFQRLGAEYKKKLDETPIVGKVTEFLHIDTVAESIGDQIKKIINSHAAPALQTLSNAQTMLTSFDKLLTDALGSFSAINMHLLNSDKLIAQVTVEQDKALQAMQDILNYMKDLSQ